MKGLPYYQSVLKGQGFTSRIIEDTDRDFPILEVLLPEDGEGRNRLLTVAEVDEAGVGFVAMNAQLPFLADSTSVGEVARLICFLNKSMDTAIFGLSEVDASMHVQSYQPTPSGKDGKQIFLRQAGTMLLVLDSFTELIEVVASGKVGFPDAIQEVVKLYQK